MSKNTISLELTLCNCEAEMVIKALENYKTRKGIEQSSREDIIKLIEYQMNKVGKNNE